MHFRRITALHLGEWGTMGNLCAPAAEPPTPNPADDEAYSPPLGAPAEGNPIGENTRHHPNVAGPDPPSEAETPGHPTP